MRRRIPLLLLALAVALGACTDAGELGGPSLGGTPAAVIGDVEVSPADLQDETELWALNPEFLRQIGVVETGNEGARTTALTSFVLSHRVLSEQARQLAEAIGYSPTPDEVDDIIAAVDQQFVTADGGSLFLVYPEDFRQRLGLDLAYQNNLNQIDASAFAAPLVEISSRYGVAEVVDDQLGIVQVRPPAGPRPSPVGLGLLGS